MGLKQGPYKEYYDNDAIKSEGNYKDDKKDGTFKQYAEDGRVIKKEEYRNGELMPELVRDDDKFEVKSGLLFERFYTRCRNYKKAVAEGIFREYDKQGNLSGTSILQRR
jgi:antitoxin component YwqK of YwqJK toxin-antitoxin module